MQLLMQSISIGGEFLEGIVVRDPSGEEWLTSERDRYRRMAVETLEKLLIRQREAGEMSAAVETGERLVGLEPLRESAWRQLMLVYATQGERGQALKAYTRCTDILEKELGIKPLSKSFINFPPTTRFQHFEIFIITQS